MKELPFDIELVGGRILHIIEVDETLKPCEDRDCFENGQKFQKMYSCNARPYTFNTSSLSEDIILTLLEAEESRNDTNRS